MKIGIRWIAASLLGIAPACGSEASSGEDEVDDGDTAGEGSSGGPMGTSGVSSSGSGVSLSGGEGTSGAEGGDEGDPGDPSGGEGGSGGEPLDPGQLTAAEWRDLDHWDFWRALFDAQSEWADMEEHWSFYTGSRFEVLASDGELPAIDVAVTLQDAQGEPVWRARTDNLGRAELFSGLFGDAPQGPFTIVAGAGSVEAAPGTPIEIDIAAPAPSNALDLMFMIDTTGSMGDELEYLKVELQDVIETVQAESSQSLDINLSVNFYRDHGDEYVVRSFPFDSDIANSISRLGAQSADGGGDVEEAVPEAMADAVDGHQWRTEARARLLFLVLDAPPHYTTDNIASLQESTRLAAEKGIRIIPLAASGVDKDTEFLLRFFDISTGGTYTFLTDDSGIGGDHLEPTVGEYQVEQLNDLLIRLINESVE